MNESFDRQRLIAIVKNAILSENEEEMSAAIRTVLSALPEEMLNAAIVEYATRISKEENK